jgi:hypothetical protein
MSYSIRVDVKDGVATVVEAGTTTGEAAPPDGMYNINGHVPTAGTWKAENISIARSEKDDQGQDQMIIQASGTHQRVQLPK